MTIDLPENLAAMVQKRVVERGFPSAQEYIATLIRSDDTDEWWASLSDDEKREQEAFEARITKSLTTGGPDLSLEEVFSEAMRRVRGGRPQGAAHPDTP
jgi:Arc/MetJ-type ribon-helix-helix transcriptional regulator